MGKVSCFDLETSYGRSFKDEPVKQFEVPEGITYAQIDKKSGLLPSELTPVCIL